MLGFIFVWKPKGWKFLSQKLPLFGSYFLMVVFTCIPSTGMAAKLCFVLEAAHFIGELATSVYYIKDGNSHKHQVNMLFTCNCSSSKLLLFHFLAKFLRNHGYCALLPLFPLQELFFPDLGSPGQTVKHTASFPNIMKHSSAKKLFL